MAPLRGWAPRGQRLKAKVPHGRWKAMTFLAVLRLDEAYRLGGRLIGAGPLRSRIASCQRRYAVSLRRIHAES